MKVTLSVIKADIGSIGGHLRPSDEVVGEVQSRINDNNKGLFIDSYVGFTGDDIAILMTHERGENDSKIHRLAWNTFMEGAKVAKDQGLYGAGQDLLKDSFSGKVKGMGPAVAEMEFEERENEPFILFAADKTAPGAYNLPLYLAFADPMYNSGLILSQKMNKGFKFSIMDVDYIKADRIVSLNTREDLYEIAALLRDNERYVVKSIYSNSNGEQAAAVSTARLHNVAGVHTGKDDPVMLVRVQGAFPATGEMLSPFSIGHYVAGFMRGSHNGPLMPLKMNSSMSYFDGPPGVSAMAFSVKNGRLTGPADCFDHPFWDYIRDKVSLKALHIREQGFSGIAMLPYSELEYGGIVEKLKAIDKKFKLRKKK
jgi:fructose 1,6-bisphosphate aldolase/phosphatase